MTLEGAAPGVAVVPRPAATVMLLRDGSAGLEVLLLERASSTPFVPGAHVFPGGAVDAADHELDGVADGLEPASADALLGVSGGGLAFWATGVRECLEEAGVVLARDRAGRPVDEDHPFFADLDATRRALETGTRTLAEVYREHDLRLPLDALAYVARWITPEPSPRRYDTRFFAAAMPDGQRAGADGWEAVQAGWWTPADALSDWQAGHIELIEPTVASLRLLGQLPCVDAAMHTLHAGITVEGASP